MKTDEKTNENDDRRPKMRPCAWCGCSRNRTNGYLDHCGADCRDSHRNYMKHYEATATQYVRRVEQGGRNG